MAALIVSLPGQNQRPGGPSASPSHARPECRLGGRTYAHRPGFLYKGSSHRGSPVLAPSPPLASPSQTRAIVLLAVAGFAGQSMVRSADSLLPQIAADFAVTVGAASIVVSAYSLMHGSMQLVIGPIGDRFGD